MLIRSLKTIFFFLLLACFQQDVLAQVNIQVDVYQVSTSIPDCDGFLSGDSDAAWWWTGGDISNECFEFTCNGCTQATNISLFNENYICSGDIPNSISATFSGCENDGAGCTFGAFPGICDGNAAVLTNTISFPSTIDTTLLGPFCANSTGCAGQWCYWISVKRTGSITTANNDQICDAIDLGTLNSGGTLGDDTLSNYNNLCATNTGDPNPWGGNNDQGVWFEFTTGPSPAANIDFNAFSDPANIGDNIDLQLALYESSNGTCSGALSLIEDEYDGLGLFDDEDMTVSCLEPNTTYFLLVDGEYSNIINPNGDEGYFGLEIIDNGIAQAADLICDAQNLGIVPNSGSVTTGSLNQSNVCATNTSDPTPSDWGIQQGVWYQFQAPASGNVIIDAVSDLPFPIGVDAIDLQLALYSTAGGICSGTLTEIAADYNPIIFDENLNVKCLTPGENYWVLIDGSTLNVDGIFGLTISDGGTPPATNDLICNATALGAPVVGTPVSALNQNNYCADNIFEPIPSNWGNDQGVWYTFIAPSSGKVEIILDDYGLFSPDRIDLQVAVYDLAGAVCSGVPSELNSEHDGIGIVWDEEMEVECLVPGREYWILVDGEGSLLDPDLQEGVFDIEVVADPRDPAGINNAPCDAIALGDPTGTPIGTTPGLLHASQNNYCADASGEPQPSGFTADQTVWYTFVAPSNGAVNIQAVSDAVIGGVDAINLEIAVWSAPSCSGPWVEIISGSDLLYDIDMDIWCLDIGQTYYIQIDGAPPVLLGGHEGYFDLTITEIPPIPVSPNDLICNATNLGNPWNSAVNITGQHNLCAGNIGDSIPSAFVPDQTVWYTFTTPLTGGPFAIDIQATSDLAWPFGIDAVDLQLAVFESSDNTCTGSLSEVTSEYSTLDLFDEFMNVPCLEAGNTYYLMVDGSDLNVQGYFDLNLSAAAAVPIPTNDDICNNISLGAVPIGGSINDGIDYSNFCTSTEPGEPNPFSIEQTVWFSFFAPAHVGLNATSNVTVSVTSDPGGLGNTVDLQLAVYESSNMLCSGTMNLLEDGDADPISSFDASVSVTCLYPGQEYWLQVDGSILNQEGYFRIEIQDDGQGLRPSNNLICNATNLGAVPNGGNINDGIDYSNLCSDTEIGEPNPSAFSIEKTVWFTFEAPTSGNVTINALSDPNLIGDPVDLQLALWYSDDNTCTGNFLEANSDYDIFSFDESLIVTCLEAGRTYFLQVDGSEGLLGDSDGWFTLEITDDGGSSSFPYNNDICNAYDFGTPSGIQTLLAESNECANVEVGEPGVAGYATKTVWYEFTAPPSGSIEIDVVSTDLLLGMDPEVYLFSSTNDSCTGTLQALEQSNWPTALITENITSNCLVPGNTYFIQVDGQLLVSEGTFNISIEDPNPLFGTGLPGDNEPSNNDCSDAILLSVQSESCFIGTGIFDQFNYGEPTISSDASIIQGCGNSCGETWYQFTMPASGNVLVEGNDDDIGGGIPFGDFSNLNITAYSGTCGALSVIECDTGGLSSDPILSFGAPAGSTIWLQVFSEGGADDNELFELCVSEGCGFDDCLDAVASPLTFGTPYCFNTTTATGETIPADDGYFECSEGDSPENSIYFYFDITCGNEVTISLLNVQINGSCILGITPTDGMNLTFMEDSSPCDNMPETIIDCENFTSCDVQPINWSQTYTGLTPNTSYVIMIDGGFATLGGDVNGEILITGLSTDSTFASATSCLPADTGTAVQNLMNANLCDSVHTITTTLLLSDSTFASATSCLPADTGVAVQNLMNANLCDSVHTITTTLLASDSTFASATSCLPADTGIAVQNLMNANLCDSVHTITTTLLASDSTFANAISCLPADTGVAVQNLMNANLCDSVHTITTTLLASDSTFAFETSCLPADTGVAVQNLMNANLCDSVHTITTTLLLSDSTFATATSCNPTDTGVAVQNLINVNLCDSIHTINTTLLASDSTFANATSCLPADTGVAVQNLMNANLCDSVHTITTTLLASDSTFANATSCLPADTGVAVQNLMNANLCDSVHTITTTLLASDSTFASATSCLPADTGIAVQNLMNANLCDSVHTITTTLLASDSTFANATSCLPADTGVAVQNLMNANLCDSVHTITTTLLASDSTFANATSCNPADTGVAVQNLMNANLCDSVHTINTTLLASDSTFANATSCNPADTGVAVQNLMNTNLCDSVHTITTTLLASDSTFANATSCLPADTGTAVQNLMNANLCDSVHTITTTLLLSDSTFAFETSCLPADTGVAVQNLMNANLCDSVHTITTTFLLSDSTFASATSCLPADTGVAVQNLMNANLCDSVHTITTTLLASDSTFAFETSCLPADTGVAVQNLMNANLCDSAHTITTTLLLSDSTFASATSCLPADTGVAVQNLMNANLCDSVHTINTTLLASDSTFASATSCLPADTGIAVQNLMNANLCDSVHTITTTLLASDSTFASATSCLPADTGIAVQNLMNANLCDSVHTITTTLLASDSTFANAISCLPADTGVAVQNLMNANLCDSVHTITTTLLASDSTFANATSCNPADTGVAVQNLMNANLCDSVHTINTTLLASDSTFANATSCNPADTGVAVQNLMNTNLCDSVHTITTTLLASDSTFANATSCLPADTGTAVQNLMNANLCDSVHTITTTLLLSDSTFAFETSCLPADTGVAVQNLMNANLCDSVHTITTTFLLSDSTFASATSCLPADTGVAVQNLMNANLCDSVHTITTTLLASDSTFANATSCNPADTGVAVQNLMNANLCDSVHTINTTLLASDSTFANATSCNPADTGVAVQNLMNTNLCDSVHTITTTLLASDSTFANATSCLPADTGTAVQNLMNANLCDSVHTITTTLLLSDSTFAFETSCLPADTGVAVQNLMNANLCDSVHTITTTFLLSDSTFASATSCLPADTGVAVQNLMNANLCDSVHTITTTLLASDSTFAFETSCLPADTGVAVQNLMNANLCDSVHTINTTLLASDSTFANATSCLPADTGVAVQNLMNANLCDSVHTITTTLLASDSTFANATSCNPADTGVAVQNLMNANLCDSVHTINTTLLASDSTFANATSCNPADTGVAVQNLMNTNLCDSVHTITTTLLLSDSTFASATSCLPADTGTAVQNLMNANLCDSVHTITTTLLLSDSTFAFETSCLPADTGVAVQNLMNANLCDSVHTITTTFLLSDSTFASATSCLPADTGVAVQNLMNANLCDSVHTINTTLLASDSTFASATSCLPADTGIAVQNLMNANLCDSVHTITTTLLASDSTFASATSCLPADTGIAVQNLMNATLCDSVHTITTTLLASDSTFANAISCNPADTGVAVQNLMNTNLCDSVHTITTTLLASDSTFANATSCLPADTGTAVQNLMNANLCDSVHTITTTLLLSDSTFAFETSCLPADTGVAVQNLMNANLCDSVHTITTTLLASDSTFASATSCLPADTGIAVQNLMNANLCDSVHTITTTLLASSTSIDAITACDSYTWIDGVNYTASNNTAIDTLINAAGCDSIITLNLTIINSTTSTDAITACNSYTWIDGITYNASNNTAIDTLVNAVGCDSIVTLNLTILNSTTSNDPVTACDSFIWIDGVNYTASNNIATDTLVNVVGCDSIVTLNLTILNSTTSIDAITSCDSYTWIDGLTYSASNTTATDTLINAAGCDSVITLNLTINYSNIVTDSQVACESYTWIDGNTYTNSNNTASVTLINTFGCDSVVNLDLTINNTGIIGSTQDTIAVCESFNIEIEMIAQNIISYQWQLNNGTGFVNLSDLGIYSGTQSNLLIISPIDESLTGNIYRIVLVDECGNNYTDETFVRVTEPHSVENPLADIQKCLRDSSLIVVDYNGFNYEWDNGQTGPYLVANETGSYTVTFTENLTNCAMEDEIYVEIEDCIDNCVVMAPTGFSPQSSTGQNDIFNVISSCDEGFSFYEFRIYNRWGEMIFLSDTHDNGWDGTYKNVDAKIGVYVYYLEYTKNGQTKKEIIKGQVTLIR